MVVQFVYFFMNVPLNRDWKIMPINAQFQEFWTLNALNLCNSFPNPIYVVKTLILKTEMQRFLCVSEHV